MAKITVTPKCSLCGALVPIEVEEKDWNVFCNTPRSQRPNIQDLFPYVTASDREMFVSGTCSVCWDSMFADDGDDEDDEEFNEDELNKLYYDTRF